MAQYNLYKYWVVVIIKDMFFDWNQWRVKILVWMRISMSMIGEKTEKK